jgi:hydroxyethylthiazole kinase
MNHALEIRESLRKVRAAAPLVHNITNYVVMNNTANALLALGASPVMAHAIEEVEDFVALSSALVINIGTLSSAWIASMRLAAGKARAMGKPWVLDPVGVGATALRTSVAQEFARMGPTVVRANASEVLAMAGRNWGVTKGVDSTDPSAAALSAGKWLAKSSGTVVVISGTVDSVTDGERVLEVHNGHPMMTSVTGLGCTASALVGAFLVVQPDRVLASAQAMAVLGVAGELAAKRSLGPGSLQLHLTDALYTLDERALSRLKIKSAGL